MLEKIPGNIDSHVSDSQDRYIFHVKRTNGLAVLYIHERFVANYGHGVHLAQAYAMNDEFSRGFGPANGVRNAMIDYIDKVLERSDRLELLVGKTANMQANTFRFRKQACRFRNTIVYVVLAFVCRGLPLPNCLM
ncbi:hypothetical protein P3X46_023683 [Hevea brasiliensis]|uniref:V-SNARE coiled-coil homology domain-containing protein n=1 Tax=Hevea brasiliensis TaxID=3981 RepID=A0ABQ9LFJ2_HEVBR|nr:hypothetical protein P3X46_023683 [Hevea brasiliensis]